MCPKCCVTLSDVIFFPHLRNREGISTPFTIHPSHLNIMTVDHHASLFIQTILLDIISDTDVKCCIFTVFRAYV